MPRMLNKDVTRFMQSLSRVLQNLASERKALLAGYSSTIVFSANYSLDTYIEKSRDPNRTYYIHKMKI